MVHFCWYKLQLHERLPKDYTPNKFWKAVDKPLDILTQFSQQNQIQHVKNGRIIPSTGIAGMVQNCSGRLWSLYLSQWLLVSYSIIMPPFFFLKKNIFFSGIHSSSTCFRWYKLSCLSQHDLSVIDLKEACDLILACEMWEVVCSGKEISERCFCTHTKTVLVPLMVHILSAFDAWSYSRWPVITR